MIVRLTALFLFALAAAFIPVLNVETYLVAQQMLIPGSLVLPVLIAALGQTLGKIGWYEAGRGATRWAWMAKRLDRPRFKERSEKLRVRLEGRPWLTSGVLLASSGVSVPPIAIMSVVAGHLHIHRGLFAGTVFVGRFVRFLGALGALSAIVEALR